MTSKNKKSYKKKTDSLTRQTKDNKRGHLMLFPPSIEMANIYSELKGINSYLIKANDWKARLLAENSKTKHEECIASLIKRESKLKQKYMRLRKRVLSPEQSKRDIKRDVAKGITSDELKSYFDVYFKQSKLARPKQAGECVSDQGIQQDYDMFELGEAIEHVDYDGGSSFSYTIYDSRQYQWGFSFEVEASLYDATKWYWFDSPDSANIFIEFDIEFPRVICDSWIIWTTRYDLIVAIDNRAEMGNIISHIKTYPSPAGIEAGQGDTVYILPSDRLVDYQIERTGYHEESHSKQLYGVMDVKAGDTPALFMGSTLDLTASDGELSVRMWGGPMDGWTSSDVGLGLRGIRYLTIPKSANAGCFISTAICVSMEKDDDCSELSILRDFRDNYLRNLPNGTQLIDEYYFKAPLLLEAINNRKDAQVLLKHLNYEFLAKAIQLIQKGKKRDALDIYIHMIRYIEDLVL